MSSGFTNTTDSVKLPFFQKATAVVVIVEFAHNLMMNRVGQVQTYVQD